MGIYKITNKVNGKSYIGQSNNVERRFKEHKSIGYRSKIPFDLVLSDIGIEHFTFELIEECKSVELNEREKHWIEFYNTINDGYNYQLNSSQVFGENNPNAKLTEEDVINIRIAYLNRENKRSIYDKYSDKTTFNNFSSVWRGKTWCHVMPEVFTDESIDYYSKRASSGDRGGKSAFTNERVLELRTEYINKTAKEIYSTINEKCSLNALQQMLWGHTYKEVPIYNKKQQKWINK